MSMLVDTYEEELFANAEDSAEEFYADQPFCLEDILAEQAGKDAIRIINGETIGKATDFAHSYLKRVSDDPLLPCYHAGEKYWDYYCKILRDHIAPTRRARIAVFPSW